jgi:formylglycine-generating enzyme required for sulfatase activity/WD40 repeat protein
VIRTLERSGNPGSTLVLKGHTDRITDGHFSPNEKLTVTASEDGTARLWDAGSGSSKAILNGHRGAVHAAAFSADGQLLITAGEDGTARIWDVSSGAELMVLKGHRSVVRSASLSVDDSRAVTIGEDHTVRQWDVKNGAQLSVSAIDDGMFENLAGREGLAEAPGIAVTPDGTRVLAQGREKLFVVRTFPSTKALLDETMRESVRCLSLEERKTAYLEEEPPAWCIEQGKWPYHTLRWKAWLDAKRDGQNPAYPVAGQKVAAGADEAFQTRRFEEAMRLQGVLADAFSHATTSVPGGEPSTAAWVFAHLSRYALFSKDYDKALSAADRAIELQAEKFFLVGTPDINAHMNKAHALMFLGRADEALALHRKMRGHKIDVDGDIAKSFQNIGKAGREEIKPTLWEDGVLADFDRFRSLGMDHPQMADIEKELAGGSQSTPPVTDLPGPPVSGSPETTSPPETTRIDGEISGYKDFEGFKECDGCPEMVALSGGTFIMGSPQNEGRRDRDEGPQRQVTIKPFAIGKHEVTFAQWDACVAAGGCNGHRPTDSGARDRDRLPVINVSWQDAQGYVSWLAKQTGKPYRLPTEAEWEYAARAGTTTPFSFGETINTAQANYDGRSYYGRRGRKGEYRKHAVPVGSLPANSWGLYEMHGNVWEWVEDCWHESYKDAPQDGSAWIETSCTDRVGRGGSWNNKPKDLRSASRAQGRPDDRYDLMGFRVARPFTP